MGKPHIEVLIEEAISGPGLPLLVSQEERDAFWVERHHRKERERLEKIAKREAKAEVIAKYAATVPLSEFPKFRKVPRLSRNIVITEKIDGVNVSVYIGEDGTFGVGSKNDWITPAKDNFGFAKWAWDHKDDLMKLGPGHHFGEWWGEGIQRAYGLKERRFSLFNTMRWDKPPDDLSDFAVRPDCCHVVPIIYQGPMSLEAVYIALDLLRGAGSLAAPGFRDPEGVIMYHRASNTMFKKTLKRDEKPKGSLEVA